MTTRRRAVARFFGIGLIALLVVGQIVDVVGRQYLDWYAAQVQGIISSEKQHLENRSRFLISDAPVEQNAAAWYRLAFAKLAPASDQTLQMLKEAASREFEDDSRSLRNLLETRCEEVQSSRVRSALRSTRCDWELSYSWSGSAEWDFSTESLNLAYCQLLKGHLQARESDREDATTTYMEMLSFGSDLDGGNLMMNILGITVWKLGIGGLRRLVDSASDDKTLMSVIAQRLSMFEGRLPTLRTGLTFERMWLATGMATEAKGFVDGHRAGFGLLIPWRAVAAWRLSREIPILDELRLAAVAEDIATRKRLENAIKRRVLRSRSPLVTDEVAIGVWPRFASEADDVAQSYHVLRVAVALQAWHAAQGLYPVNSDVLSLPLDRYRLRYEQTNQGQGYRLFDLNIDWSTLLLDHIHRTN